MKLEDVTKIEVDSARAKIKKLPKTGKEDQFNGLAIATLVLTIIFPVAALITGVLSLREINHTRERGKIFAMVGIAVGGSTVAIALYILIILWNF